MSIDAELLKKMQIQGRILNINWSQVIEGLILPVVFSFDEVVNYVKQSKKIDKMEIKVLVQKVLLEFNSKCYEVHKANEGNFIKKENRL